MSNELIVKEDQGSFFNMDNFEKNMRLATILSKSAFVSSETYKNKPENILIALQLGYEVGLQPLQALQNIAVINGNPTIWGDAVMALGLSHPECEWINETPILDNAGKIVGYKCSVKRKGHELHEAIFTIDMAKTAGLWGKRTWATYPERMLQMRARRAIKDKFADIFKGLQIREEVEDYNPSSSFQSGEKLIPNIFVASEIPEAKVFVTENTESPTNDKIIEEITVTDYGMHQDFEVKYAPDHILPASKMQEVALTDTGMKVEMSDDEFEKEKRSALFKFAALGIKQEQIFDKFNITSIKELDRDDFKCLLDIGKSIKNGKSTWEDFVGKDK